jgi:tRNA dimethylallyltransferase
MGCIIAIVGPTGIGKSSLGIHLAREFQGEIINTDSRQIYRYMDIGTAKPSPEERTLIPHHVIDIINPDENFSLAQFQELAFKTIDEIQRRGKLPFLVGGSGLYVRAVVEGWDTPRVPPDLEFRKHMEQRAEAGETVAIYEELKKLDPDAARNIDPRNVRRVIRALEVTRAAQVPFSSLQKKKSPPFQTMTIGLTTNRDELYRRTDRRVDDMIERGLIEEVKNLLKMGYGFDLPAMSGIGYRQIGEYLEGKTNLESAVYRIKTETHRFIRHQYNWFRLADPHIRWFDIQEKGMEDRVVEEVGRFIEVHS